MPFAVCLADRQMLGCMHRNFPHGSILRRKCPLALQVVMANTENAAANWRVRGIGLRAFRLRCSVSSLGSSETCVSRPAPSSSSTWALSSPTSCGHCRCKSLYVSFSSSRKHSSAVRRWQVILACAVGCIVAPLGCCIDCASTPAT